MKSVIGLLLLLCTFIFTNSIAQGNKQNKILKDLGNPNYTNLNINNISTFFYNNGISEIGLNGENGFRFPKSTSKSAVFSSGFLWGALVSGDPQPRVGGSAYRTGLKGGKIISTGFPENQDLNHVRIYRVRHDVYPGGPNVDLSSEINDEGKTEQQIRNQYEKDWLEWRAIDGAPFEDKNANGIYEPGTDIPGILNADQTIWYVANDLNSNQTMFLYGALPLGIELQVTIWAYSSDDFLNNMLFRKYKMINKSSTPFNDVYISMWSDVDLGNAGDDNVGCDTTLNLGYTYNAEEYDDVYFPLAPPAVGFNLLKGPSISNNISLPMTAHYFFFGGSMSWGDPSQNNIDGSTEFYNYMRGRDPNTGALFINPTTGNQTTFALSGDPLTKTGWRDTLQVFGGDRRNGIASGPFQIAVGDTQEIIIAEIAALGTDRLNSFKKLKYYTILTKDFYESGMMSVFSNRIQIPKAEVTSTISQIKLDWDLNSTLTDSIESFNENGYKFQGYNVYQFSNDLALKEIGTKIATYDIVDGVTAIQGIVSDPNTGLPIAGILQSGTDSGINRIFATDFDYINNEHMIIGKKYYFGISAYTYNADPQSKPRSSESMMQLIEVVYYENYPGAAYGDNILINHSEGSGDAEITVSVADPTKLTGNNYELFFTEQNEIRLPSGDWVGAAVVNRVTGPDTLTGSSINIAAIYGPQVGILELKFSLDLVSSDFDYADGIALRFPAGVTILDVYYVNALIAGNLVILGDTSHPYTGNGLFAGGEEWSVFIRANLPLAISWTIYDDGYGGGPVDVSGITTVSTAGNATRQAKYWNVKNLSNNVLGLSNQSVVGGVLQFPTRDDLNADLLRPSAPIIDGLFINLNSAQYNAAKEFSDLSLLNPANSTTQLTQTSSTSTLDIQNYTIFGAISSTANDNFDIGTTDIEQLQQDYELRFTGVWDSTIVNSKKIYFIKSGGQMATLFAGVSSNSIATHPLNPNPGVNNPFLLRIPFEVWNKNTGSQVNLIFRDRIQDSENNPFYSWNPRNRMYAVIVNSTYNANAVITSSPSDTKNALATWVLVFSGTNYHLSDVVTVTYPNTLKIGVDKFTFTSPRKVIEEKLTSYKIYDNYPNPFNPATKIRFFLPEAGQVKVEVFNILGQRVAALTDKEFNAGVHGLSFDGSPFASGIYIYTIEVKDKFFEAKKMLLLK